MLSDLKGHYFPKIWNFKKYNLIITCKCVSTSLFPYFYLLNSKNRLKLFKASMWSYFIVYIILQPLFFQKFYEEIHFNFAKCLLRIHMVASARFGIKKKLNCSFLYFTPVSNGKMTYKKLSVHAIGIEIF